MTATWKTKGQIDLEKQKADIISQLSILDGVISREAEDLYSDLDKTPSLQKRSDAIAQKRALRAELASLSS